MFVDEARVQVTAGRGGDGSVSFHREKYQPRGGPDGGNGGHGGSVVLVAGDNVGSLSWLRDHPHQRAAAGGPGRSNNRSGAEAADLVLDVPVGTVVRDEEGHVLADLPVPGDRYVAAAGGRGGRGNAAFLSESRRAPGFGELGEPGESRWVRLELRLIAEVAVIGLPNAGKSTLVGAVSAARPKVAAYPFTTLEPTLGRVETSGSGDSLGDGTFTICDIPGLIEGAHEGRGLGLGFLRHAERALAFVHLVDLSAEGDPLAAYRLVRQEVVAYRPELAERPEVVALNKVDAVDPPVAQEVAERFAAAGVTPLVVSAAAGTGLDALVARLVEVLATEREAAAGRRGFELFRTERRALSVDREGEAWRLTGGSVQRWVAMCDLGNPQAVAHLQERLDRAGVERLLSAAGVTPGDEVRIGEKTFEWWPSASSTGQRRPGAHHGAAGGAPAQRRPGRS
jgi:GTP-binding protein